MSETETIDDTERARTGWSCKIGTVPMVVRLHAKDISRLATGNFVRIKRDFPHFASPWERVYVTDVEVSGYFTADR